MEVMLQVLDPLFLPKDLDQHVDGWQAQRFFAAQAYYGGADKTWSVRHCRSFRSRSSALPKRSASSRTRADFCSKRKKHD